MMTSNGNAELDIEEDLKLNRADTTHMKKGESKGHGHHFHKHKNLEEIQRRKALYGTRAKSKIFEQAVNSNGKSWGQNINKCDQEEENKKNVKSCKEKIIISQNNK